MNNEQMWKNYNWYSTESEHYSEKDMHESKFLELKNCKTLRRQPNLITKRWKTILWRQIKATILTMQSSQTSQTLMASQCLYLTHTLSRPERRAAGLLQL